MVVSDGWNFKTVFGGGNGVIYAIPTQTSDQYDEYISRPTVPIVMPKQAAMTIRNITLNQ